MRFFLISVVILLGIPGCTAQVPKTAQPENPCDPPPPCLPAKEQPFSFVFEWKPSKRSPKLPRVISSQSKISGDGPIVMLPVPKAADSYRVLFNNPLALKWENKTTFTAYLQLEKRIDTLHFTVKEVILDCCPQLVITSIYQNDKSVCDDCAGKGPVKWRK